MKAPHENFLRTPLIIFHTFCDFPLIAQSGTRHITISLIGCARHTYSIGPWYGRNWELL